MMRSLKLACLAVAILVLSGIAGAQNPSVLTATTIKDASGNLLSAGYVCFQTQCLRVTSGAATGTIYQGVGTLTVTDMARNAILTVPSVTIAASTFNYDAYTITGPSFGFLSVSTSPFFPCASPATFRNFYDNSPWSCMIANGSPTWVSVSSLKPAASGLYSGVGVPAFYCTAPCSWTRSDASPTASATYGLLATQGTVSNNWQLQGGAGGATSTTLLANPMVEYQLPGGTGTTLTDLSPNGYNGTFASAAPTWVTGGLLFAPGQGVTLPAALNTARTFLFGIYLNPLALNNTVSGTMVLNQYPALLTSSTGASGLNLLYVRSQGTGSLLNYGQVFAPTVFSNNTHITQTAQLVAGANVLGFTCGAGSGDVDHIYVNGIETSYELQGACAGLQNTAGGNFFLGSSAVSPWANSGIAGTLVSFDAFAGELTAAQIVDATGAISAFMSKHGFNLTPRLGQVTVPTLTACCDSQTVGYPSYTNYFGSLNLTNQPAYTVNNVGITGLQIQAVAGSAMLRDANYCKGPSGPNPFILLGGTNDITNGGASPETAWEYLASITRQLKEVGCRVYVGTMLSRTGVDAQKDTYDALILSKIRSGAGADGIVDYAAIPALGADGASATSAFVDGVHPTPANYGVMGQVLSNSLNFYNGSTAANPNTTAAATYTMASGDRYLRMTAGTALTAPDCLGPSGETYTIENASSSAGTIIGLPTGGATASANLYNYATDTQSALISETDGTLLSSSSYSAYASTGFIKLTAGAAWSTSLAVGRYNSGSTTYGGAYYDMSGNYIGNLGYTYTDSSQPQTFTAPTNGAATSVQLRFYYKTSSSATPVSTAAMVNEGSSVLPWVAYSAGTAGPTVEPINGSTSTVAVPANSTMFLIDVANPKTAGGCHWTLK